MPLDKRLLILGPDVAFNLLMQSELKLNGIRANVGGTHSVTSLKAVAKKIPPSAILVSASLREGWGFDLLNAVKILFPHAALMVLAEGFYLNARAVESLGIACIFEPSRNLKLIAKQIADCYESQRLKDRDFNVS